MKTILASMLVLFYVAFCLVQGFPGDAGNNSNENMHHGLQHGFMKCAGKNFTITPAMISTVETCHNKTKQNSAAKMDKLKGPELKTFKDSVKSCPMICAGQAFGIFDVDGKIVSSKAVSMLNEVAPATNVKDLTAGLRGCADKHESTLIVKEGDCSSYNDLIDCAFNALTKVCQP